jgi:hypothetical protein
MVTVVGYAITNTGIQIPLKNTSVTNGTEFSLQTDSDVTTTSQDIGTYAPGQTITSLEVYAPTSVSYVYVLRQGVILSFGSPNVAGISNSASPLCAPVTLRPGDQVRCLSLSATARNAALCVYTNTGVARIFVGTPAGAATTNLNDLQDSNNSIGDTLQGQTIVKALFTSVDKSKIVSSGGAWIRNASAQVVGIIPASSPQDVEPMITNTAVPISLNWNATVVTSS